MTPVYKFTKTNSNLTGWFFIIAAISSIIGLKLYDPILNDRNFLISANHHYTQIIIGAVSELILCVSAVGTSIMLFPLLKSYNERIALGYLSFRLLEVVFIMIGTVSILTALTVSEQFSNGLISDKDNALNLMLILKGVHKWTFILGPNFMLAINTFLYSYFFIKTDLMPKNLARLGITASFLIMIAAMLEMFDIIQQISMWGILLALPIALYEMTLAVLLLVKGFKS
jgi:hypothetical protein